MLRDLTRLALATIIAACVVSADTSPHFEVATVRRSGPELRTRHFTIQGRRFLTFDTSLADLIQFAFGLHTRQLAGGPSWVGSEKFDVVGQAVGNSTPTEHEWMQMVANLVVERFHLRYHMEKRELPVYTIGVERGSPKLEVSGSDPHALPSLGFRGRGQLMARNASIGDLAWELQSAVLDRPVIDQTGLARRFDFTLTWTPDEFQTSALAAESRTDSETAPNLFTAIRQQLGLRLTATKSSAEVMVIEQIERPVVD